MMPLVEAFLCNKKEQIQGTFPISRYACDYDFAQCNFKSMSYVILTNRADMKDVDEMLNQGLVYKHKESHALIYMLPHPLAATSIDARLGVQKFPL